MTRPVSVLTARRLLLGMFAWLGVAAVAHGDPAPPLPVDPGAWINSGPLSLERLKGKGIVLWFFEEEDRGSSARWKAMLESAKAYEGKPVVFIAVNSGTPRAKLEGFARSVKIPWPVLVDTSRDFEKACGLFQPITPQNVSQFRLISPDGEIQTEVSEELETIADKALEGAAWKIEPDTIPDALKSAWMAFETGNYKGLAGTLKKSATSNKADVKEAAGKLMEVIQAEIDDQMARTKEAQEDNPYRSFELLSELTEHFNGFELPKEVLSLKKDLTKNPKVKSGQSAARNLDLARKQMASGNPALKARSKATLEKIAEEFPETSLGQQAKTLIQFAEE